MGITQSESIAVSYLRVIATLLILTCHILQALGNRWAWVLNIGVQVFFFISGYLYGHKNIVNWKSWYINRFKKIYIPFISTVFIFVILLFLFNYTFSPLNIISYVFASQWFYGNIFGLEHLWFITAVLLCYLSTPLLQSLKSDNILPLIVLFIYSLYELFIVRYDVKVFIPLFIFAFGYFYACLESRWKTSTTIMLLTICCIVIFHTTWGDILVYNSRQNQVFHTYCGITFSILFLQLASKLRNIILLPIGHFIDKYSYEIYLIHHPLILGPLSLMFASDYISANVIAILLLTVLSSVFLKWIFNRILDKIPS